MQRIFNTNVLRRHFVRSEQRGIEPELDLRSEHAAHGPASAGGGSRQVWWVANPASRQVVQPLAFADQPSAT